MNNKIFKSLIYISIFCFNANLLFATNKVKETSEKPALVLFIMIDHFSEDYLQRYSEKFSEKGLKMLMNEGAYFKYTKHPYLSNQASPGYASVSTGSLPAQHGIIADAWYLRLQEEVQNSISSTEYKTVGGSFQSGNFAPTKLLSSTLADELKISSRFNSKVYSISMDAKCAVFMGGHSADAAYWYDNKTGNWVSSSYYMDSLEENVKTFNSKNWPDTYLEKDWYTYYAIEQYKASWTDNNQYEQGFGNQNTFPYNLAKLKKEYGYGILRSLPYGNTLTKDLAISTIYNQKLGKSGNTDLLCVGFAANQMIEDVFGSNSVEMQDTWLRLDNDIEHLLKFIDEEIGLENTLIVVSGAYGKSDDLKYRTDHGIPGGYYNSKASLALLKSYLNIIYGENEWVKFYHQQQFYLNRKLIEDKGIKLEEIQNKAATFLVEFSGIADVLTSTTLQRSNLFNSYLEDYQNSYNPQRSGDLMIMLQPGYEEKVWTEPIKNYEDIVPTIFYGWGIDAQVISSEIRSIDIAPTISKMISISVPNSAVNSYIKELVE